jgi:hypothetical protein
MPIGMCGEPPGRPADAENAHGARGNRWSAMVTAVTGGQAEGCCDLGSSTSRTSQYDPECLPGLPTVLASRRLRPGSSDARSPAGLMRDCERLKRRATP